MLGVISVVSSTIPHKVDTKRTTGTRERDHRGAALHRHVGTITTPRSRTGDSAGSRARAVMPHAQPRPSRSWRGARNHTCIRP